MRINIASIKAEVKFGDIIVVKGNNISNKHTQMFLQIIDVSGKIRLLNIETGHCVSDTLYLSNCEIGLLLESIKKNWSAWKVVEIYDGKKCEVNLPVK